MSHDDQLRQLLQRRFGFPDFRPHQEAVCRALVQGADVLLVMPTGSGKSLCYQLPALAREGTALVISPLIALMEDQVVKLQRHGLRAERIHSGRDRAASRQVCRDYLEGKLDLLFIAPERLGVPGFPELLGRGRLALVAVDEAHCISHWGHDFRPDYRMIQQRLRRAEWGSQSGVRSGAHPWVRASPEGATSLPVPLVALTATATPLVQDDIVCQLGMQRVQRHIHGFRRTNIAVELVELPPGQRAQVVQDVLGQPERRPAIVYAPSRRETEQLAQQLTRAGLRADAYHAGLTAARRDVVQTAFLGGQLEIIVATIAFGMGVDKPDVRTVIHTGMPASIEGYYQEIGRAGRDGQPSRAILLQSYGDRRTHQWFLERDYPEPDVLARIHHRLSNAPVAREVLRAQWGSENEEVFDGALAKLWVHGGATVDTEDRVRRGPDGAWRERYVEQRQHRQRQLELMGQFTQLPACRMLQLVQHFGDQEDSGLACGQCDFCAPTRVVVQHRRGAEASELEQMTRILHALAHQNNQAAGRVFRALSGGAPLGCGAERAKHGREFGTQRREFEELVEGLARAGLLHVREDSFARDGQTISYRRLSLTARGAAVVQGKQPLDPSIQLPRHETLPRKQQKRKTSARGAGEPRSRAERSARDKTASIDTSAASPALVQALKQWRLAEALERKLPAFCVLSDRTLMTIATLRPTTDDALLAVPGVGGKFIQRYGARVLTLVADA